MLDERRKRYLEAMGVPVYVRRGGDTGEPPAAAAGIAEKPTPTSMPVPEDLDAICAGEVETLGWPELRTRVAACTACDLHQGRTSTVFGVGNPDADLMVIGEAPGAEEDRQGEPFVGRAGQLLTAMLGAIGLNRGDVFIANILKCRPPGNRNPVSSEIACCLPYLMRQVALLQPRLIFSVGGVSAHNLLKTEEPVGHLRGQVHSFGPDGIPLVVSYHPAYLLRKPAEKAKAWQDLQMIKGMLDKP